MAFIRLGLAGPDAGFYIMKRSAFGKESHILTYASSGLLEPAALKSLIIKSLDSDKALDIETIDLSGQSALADYIIVATGTSSKQVTRIAEKLEERLRARGYKELRTEGLAQGNWVVLDAGDVIVHLFRPEVRQFYNIEKMWTMTAADALTADLYSA